MIKRALKAMPFILLLVVGLGLWEAYTRIWQIPNYKLPSPSSIFIQKKSMYLLLWYHFRYTLIETMAGLGFGVSIGLITAILLHWIPDFLRRAFYPLIASINSMPIAMIAPFIILYFGTGIESKLVVASICSFFPIVCHTYGGLQSVDPVCSKYMESLDASRWQKLIHLELPYTADRIFDSLKTANVVIVGVVVAEIFGGNRGLGFFAINLSNRMDSDGVFLTTIVTMIMGIALVSIVGWAKHKLIPWHPSVKNQR